MGKGDHGWGCPFLGQVPHLDFGRIPTGTPVFQNLTVLKYLNADGWVSPTEESNKPVSIKIPEINQTSVLLPATLHLASCVSYSSTAQVSKHRFLKRNGHKFMVEHPRELSSLIVKYFFP